MIAYGIGGKAATEGVTPHSPSSAHRHRQFRDVRRSAHASSRVSSLAARAPSWLLREIHVGET
jgi:hypothetical protein